MNTISFSCVEVLDNLLNKTKTQTIRPAWSKAKPYLKVGDKVKLFWKQRSRSSMFCPYCGVGAPFEYKDEPLSEFIPSHCLKCDKGDRAWFNKLLGTAIITDVFKIKMEIKCHRFFLLNIDIKHEFSEREIEEYCPNFYRMDGFTSARKMFDWFHKRYDLSTPKQFYVYRWIWEDNEVIKHERKMDQGK